MSVTPFAPMAPVPTAPTAGSTETSVDGGAAQSATPDAFAALLELLSTPVGAVTPAAADPLVQGEASTTVEDAPTDATDATAPTEESAATALPLGAAAFLAPAMAAALADPAGPTGSAGPSGQAPVAPASVGATNIDATNANATNANATNVNTADLAPKLGDSTPEAATPPAAATSPAAESAGSTESAVASIVATGNADSGTNPDQSDQRGGDRGVRAEGVTAAASTTSPAPNTVEAPNDGIEAAALRRVFPEVTKLATSGNGTHRLTMVLQPEHLGEVRVQLVVKDGSVRVSLVADAGNHAVHRALANSAPELQRLIELTGATDTRILVREANGSAATSTGSQSSPGSQAGAFADSGNWTGEHGSSSASGDGQSQRHTDGESSRPGTQTFTQPDLAPTLSTTGGRARLLDQTL